MNNEIKELVKEYERYAKENDLKLNSNKKIVEGNIRGLLKNEKKHGKKYCPCRRVTENQEEDKKIVCPCVYHKKEIEEQGHCRCFLFVKAVKK